MGLADKVLAVNDDLPIRSNLPVHSGKVRSVYWLTAEDSARLISSRGYPVAPDAPLALMVISDRISAFECIWHAEGGLAGVPGKGAALNAIATHWFDCFRQQGLADSHILEVPHPLVWVVQKARPVKIEAIARAYITGSMWRAYERGDRAICGQALPEGLQRDQALPELLITPSTKGILTGITGVPELDDVNVSRTDIEASYQAFGFRSPEDIDQYERLLRDGFTLISDALARIGQIFVDTKFEFGYVADSQGRERLIYMDEVGTPDSSRIWDAAAYADGQVLERSKERFRQLLLSHFPDPDILTNKRRMEERPVLAQQALPAEIFQEVSEIYLDIAAQITGASLTPSDNPRSEIVDVLAQDFNLIDGAAL